MELFFNNNKDFIKKKAYELQEKNKTTNWLMGLQWYKSMIPKQQKQHYKEETTKR